MSDFLDKMIPSVSGTWWSGGIYYSTPAISDQYLIECKAHCLTQQQVCHFLVIHNSICHLGHFGQSSSIIHPVTVPEAIHINSSKRTNK